MSENGVAGAANIAAAAVTVDDLPDECLEHVLAFLDLRGVGALFQVCKRFGTLTSMAWNNMQTPAGRLRAVNAAPDALVRWVRAGLAAHEIRIDNDSKPALWRQEIRMLLAQSAENPIRSDSMPAGVFWDHWPTLKNCLENDSVDGLAFLAERVHLNYINWQSVLSECLIMCKLRVLAYVCQRSGLDTKTMYAIIVSRPSSPECYALCVEHFPLPADPPDMWLYAITVGNLNALRWLGCEPQRLIELSKTSARYLRNLVISLKMLYCNSATDSMALWLRPVLAVAAERSWRLCKDPRGTKIFRAFGIHLQLGNIEVARVIAEFYLGHDIAMHSEFATIVEHVFFLGYRPQIQNITGVLGNPQLSVEQAEEFFEWFRARYLAPLTTESLDTLCAMLLRNNCSTPIADEVHARLEKVFGDRLFALLFSEKILETTSFIKPHIVDSYRRWRAYARARDPSTVLELEKRAILVSLPRTTLAISQANSCLGEPFYEYFERDEFELHLGYVLKKLTYPGFLNTLFVAAPRLMRKWLDDIDISLSSFAEHSCERLAVIEYVNESTIQAADFLLRAGNFGEPAAWLKKVLDPSRGFLFGAISRIRRRVSEKSRPGGTCQEAGISVAEYGIPLIANAGAFRTEVVQAVLLAAADLHQTEMPSVELLKIAYESDAAFLRGLMRTNLSFAAGVIHAYSAPENSPLFAATILDEAWAACPSAELVAACMRRLAALSSQAVAGTKLNKALAKMLCAHDASLSPASLVQYPLADDIAGFFASRGISVPDDALAAYLDRFMFHIRMRKFVKYVNRLRYTSEQAAQLAAQLRDAHGTLFMHPDSWLSTLGSSQGLRVSAEVLSKIVQCVDAGCDADGWPSAGH